MRSNACKNRKGLKTNKSSSLAAVRWRWLCDKTIFFQLIDDGRRFCNADNNGGRGSIVTIKINWKSLVYVAGRLMRPIGRKINYSRATVQFSRIRLVHIVHVVWYRIIPVRSTRSIEIAIVIGCWNSKLWAFESSMKSYRGNEVVKSTRKTDVNFIENRVRNTTTGFQRYIPLKI